MPKPDVRGAGAIVWRQREQLEVLVVHRPTWDDWSFPKGKVKSGESLHECCVREMREETGQHVTLGAPLGWQHYTIAGGKLKEVRYWLATPTPKSHPSLAARPKVKRASKKEIDEVRWVGVEQAKKLLSIDGDRQMLARMIHLWQTGHLATTPLLLARHARAKKRSAHQGGRGPEDTRPLTKSGAKRAARLAQILSAYGVERIVTSPWKRCVDTVAPYAQATGLALEAHEQLTEAAHASDPGKVADFVHDAVAHLARPSVVCLHRPTLPTFLSALGALTPRAFARHLPHADPWLKTGQALVVHIARQGNESTVVGIEKVRAS